MRKIVLVAGLGSVACAREAVKVDSAGARDSLVVAGPAAAPTTQSLGDSTKPSGAKTAPAAPGVPSSKPAASAPAVAQVDSVRGVVSVTGTSFDKHVMIVARGGSRRLEILGPLSALIGHVSGAEISASGTITGTQLNATRFVVRSVDGQAAIDGTLKTEGGALYIITAEGTRTRIVAPPPPLVGHDGARVWITGDPGGSVSSFGFIDPPR